MNSRANNLFINAPSLEKVVSQACTAAQFRESHYLRLVGEIKQEPIFHRKQWEYIYILRVLEQFELLRPGAKGLGFGCGKEPLAAVMAKFGLSVVVTDIPPFESSDSNWGSQNALDLFYPGICSEEIYKKQVSFRGVNMNDIPSDLGQHDFVWSCCALEHLGSLNAGLDFIVNSAKCLSSGGLGIHTTEFNVSSEEKTFESQGLSLYRKKDFFELCDRLFEIGCSVLPMNFHTGTLPEDKYIDHPPYGTKAERTHLKLMVEEFAITSFGLVIKKN